MCRCGRSQDILIQEKGKGKSFAAQDSHPTGQFIIKTDRAQDILCVLLLHRPRRQIIIGLYLTVLWTCISSASALSSFNVIILDRE